MASLLKHERQQQILEAIEDNRQVTVADLSAYFDVSEVTIRRDLHEMAERGQVRRTHGGAIAPRHAPPESPILSRMHETQDCKQAIGREAAELLVDCDSVFIGSGSTAAYVARYLTDRRDLTVVTNALSVATELAGAEGVTVVVTGGVMRKSELSLIGHIAEQALREVRVDKVVVGIPAISLEAGLTNDYLPEVMTDRAIIEMAEELVVVADHTKLGRAASAYVAPVERVTTLVTDWEAEPRILDQLKGVGIRVVVAGDERARGQ